MLLAVAAEVAQRVEVHLVRYLGERQALVVELLLQYRRRGAVEKGTVLDFVQ